jgi:hypothetical protein
LAIDLKIIYLSPMTFFVYMPLIAFGLCQVALGVKSLALGSIAMIKPGGYYILGNDNSFDDL